MDAIAIVQSFVDRMNHHDVAGLCKLMSDDHIFIDPLGTVLQGKEEMRKAWIQYFFFFPDYYLKTMDIIESNDTVGLFGKASGTYSNNGKLLKEGRWDIPAAAKAVIRHDTVAEWHVFADNEQVRQIMEKYSGK